ncbi:MAG: hypothetical protein ACXVPU_13430 [Bacteroidia bacterium]
MKKIIFFLLVILAFSFKINNENFQKFEFKGLKYLLAQTISCRNAPGFSKICSLNNIPLTFFTEGTSDTNDILIAEKVLKENLETYLNSQIKNTDSTTDLYKFLAGENKNCYPNLKEHTRQIKTFSSSNKKYMYLNLFCQYTSIKEYEDLQIKYWIVADDGGECFWQIIIDLTDKKIVCAQHNGMA